MRVCIWFPLEAFYMERGARLYLRQKAIMEERDREGNWEGVASHKFRWMGDTRGAKKKWTSSLRFDASTEHAADLKQSPFCGQSPSFMGREGKRVLMLTPLKFQMRNWYFKVRKKNSQGIPRWWIQRIEESGNITNAVFISNCWIWEMISFTEDRPNLSSPFASFFLFGLHRRFLHFLLEFNPDFFIAPQSSFLLQLFGLFDLFGSLHFVLNSSTSLLHFSPSFNHCRMILR